MSGLQANQTGYFAIGKSFFYASWWRHKLHLIWMLSYKSFDDINLFQRKLHCIFELGSAADVSRPKLISSPSDMDYCISNNDNMTRMTHLTSDATSFQPRQVCVVHGVVSELWMLWQIAIEIPPFQIVIEQISDGQREIVVTMTQCTVSCTHCVIMQNYYLLFTHQSLDTPPKFARRPRTRRWPEVEELNFKRHSGK